MVSSRKIAKRLGLAALILIPAVLVFILGRAVWVHRELPYLGNPVLNAAGKEVHHTVSDFVFTDQYGELVTLDALKDKIIIANIFCISCPKVCTEMNQQVQAVAEDFPKFNNIVFVSISVEPESDSVAALRDYAMRFNGKKLSNWRFCTGSKTEIYDWVLNDLLLANEQRGSDFIHDDKVVIIDKERHIRAILPTRPPETTPANRRNSVKMELIKNIKDDIDNLLYEYRKKELEK
jgi:protein SCO1/2